LFFLFLMIIKKCKYQCNFTTFESSKKEKFQ